MPTCGGKGSPAEKYSRRRFDMFSRVHSGSARMAAYSVGTAKNMVGWKPRSVSNTVCGVGRSG